MIDNYLGYTEFQKEIGHEIEQSHYVQAFNHEYNEEMKHQKRHGYIQRESSKNRQDVREIVYKRLLDWYRNGSNATTEKGAQGSITAKDFYKLVISCRYAALFVYSLRCLHESEKNL